MAGHNPLVYGDSLTNNLKDSTSSWMSISMILVFRLADERGLMKPRFAIWVSCGSKVKRQSSVRACFESRNVLVCQYDATTKMKRVRIVIFAPEVVHSML